MGEPIRKAWSVSRGAALLVGLVLWALLPQGGATAAVGSGDQIEPSGTPQAVLGRWLDAPESDEVRRLPEGSFRLAFQDGSTNAVIRLIERGASECSTLAAEYRIDCLSKVFRAATGPVARAPDYSAAVSDLSRLSRTLDQLVRANVDKEAPAIKKGGQSYRAVKRSALRALNQQAAAAISEAQTRLLRSAGSAQLRKVHYTRIANAVNSTKKILRS